MTVFTVVYTYLPQPEVLARLRPERYTFFQELEARGVLLASGQLMEPALGDGMLILRAADVEAATTLLEGDPYLREGLVANRLIAAWNPTMGTWVSS